jgi:excisionase family DNA binding protein
MRDRLIDLPEHNRLTGLGRSTTYELMKLGIFRAVKLGRMTRFSENEAFAWVEAQKAKAAGERQEAA